MKDRGRADKLRENSQSVLNITQIKTYVDSFCRRSHSAIYHSI